MFTVTVDREEFIAEPRDTGVLVTDSRGEPRLVPWENVVRVPSSWGVVVDGWLRSKHPTEREALDAADVHRAYGAPVVVVRIA